MKRILSYILLLLAISCTPVKYQITTQEDVDSDLDSLPFEKPNIVLPQISNRTYNILNFGADSTGITLSTDAIQTAIDKASQENGGTVVIPAGKYTTGPIILKSNVRLYCSKNAIVTFSDNLNLYPIENTSFEGLDTKRCQSPISAYCAENIAICGEGKFNGAGDSWRPLKKTKISKELWEEHLKKHPNGSITEDGETWYPSIGAIHGASLCIDQNVPIVDDDSIWEHIQAFLRPVMVHLISCKNILLEGVTFENSPAWNIHPIMCENVILSNLKIRNPWYSQNGDGLDVESSKNVIIRNCNFDVGDDAICMKSGKNEDGRRRGKPTENVIIKNNTVFHGHGGFVVGSEMSGGIRNIFVSSCTFVGTDTGLRFKSTRGRGGIVENIFIDGINMHDIATDAITIDLYYQGIPPTHKSATSKKDEVTNTIPSVSEQTPIFRDITISNCSCLDSRRALYFNGLPEMPIKNITLENVHINSILPPEFHQITGLSLENVTINKQPLYLKTN